MTEELDEVAFEALKSKISGDRGFSCASYKDRCVRRRIAVRMRARGVKTFHDYAKVLDGDSTEYERLLQVLTINVTRLFRNPEVFNAITRSVLPELFRTRGTSVNIWSAGCSSGEEAYSLAILLHEFATARGEPGAVNRFRILGTDIDDSSLEHAARGEYPESAFMEAPAAVRSTYFNAGSPAAVSDAIRSRVRFQRADLFSDQEPRGLFHLIVCRNVIIYFDRAAQERLFARFHSLLAPNGYMVLGKVETLMGESRNLFTPVDARERIYKKR